MTKGGLTNKQLKQRLYVEELFDEQEQAIIWAALDKYDTGPSEANPRLYNHLEKVRKALLEVFD